MGTGTSRCARSSVFHMSRSLPVLTFHAIEDLPAVIAFPPVLFERALAQLHGWGYRTLNLVQVTDYARRDIPFPDNSIVITFDDGYRSVYDRAFPLLQRYEFSATIFLTVGANARRTDTDRLPPMYERLMLNWEEIKEMHRSGITFGGHTLTHPDLTRLPDDQVQAEVVRGKVAIEDALNAEVNTFAYPFGRYDDRCREIVSQHFVCACSDRLGLVRRNSDSYAIERIDSYYLRNLNLFAAIPTKFFPYYIHARRIPRQLRRAVEPYLSKFSA
jgi:peptidoglycan/xylan/chitin deacetylase (PgdA/CDA1 family)